VTEGSGRNAANVTAAIANAHGDGFAARMEGDMSGLGWITTYASLTGGHLTRGGSYYFRREVLGFLPGLGGRAW